MRGELIDLSTFSVTCPVCGEKLLRIDNEHAKLHGFARLKDFREKHGITYETLQQRSREKLKQLYNMHYSRWCVVYWDERGDWHYVAKKFFSGDEYAQAKQAGIKSALPFPMNNTQIHNHLSGKNPLAIFARGDLTSRYFGFDVDSKENALQHTLKLIHALECEGIDRNDIHVSVSGGKGMHLELFIDGVITFEQWIEFGRYIRAKAGLIGEPIEFRPTVNNANAWKMPLTLHHKTGDFAGFCNKQTLESMGIQASHDYLWQIQPMSTFTIRKIIKRAVEYKHEIQHQEDAEKQRIVEEERQKKQAVKIHDERVFQTDEEMRASVIRYMEYGLVATGTRYNVTKKIALYLYHEAGQDVESIRTYLYHWTDDQIKAGKATTPISTCQKDIEDIVAWAPNTEGFFVTRRDIQITASEIDWVLSVQNRNARDLLWALLLRYKAYGRNNEFYTRDRDLQKLLCHPRPMHKGTIAKWRRELIRLRYIEADIPGQDDKKARARNFYNGKATTYRMLFEEIKDGEVIDTVEFEKEMDCRQLLRVIASKLYDEKSLKRMKLAA